MLPQSIFIVTAGEKIEHLDLALTTVVFFACNNAFLLDLLPKGSSFGWHHSKTSATASEPPIASHLC